MDSGETLLGFVTLFGPVGLLGYWLYLRGAHRRDLLDLARHAMEQGKTLDQDFIQALGATAPPSPENDLRRGSIFIGLALAVCVFAVFVEEEVLFGLSAFPGFVGIAYVLFWLRGKGSREA